MKIAVIGSGVYAKAMARLMVHNGLEVTIWTEGEVSKVIVREDMKVTNSFKEALDDAKMVFILTGSKFVPNVLEEMKSYAKDDMLFVLGSKGILENGVLLSEVFENILPEFNYAVISGPTFAVDINALEPVGFTIGCKDIENYQLIKNSLKTANFEYSKDITGIELSGTLKNAYAIGSGILSGFNYGNSIRCFYLTKVLNEMQTIFRGLGADENTVLTLAGIGDLVLTCTSLNSRNFTFGSLLSIGNKENTEIYLKNTTVEGYENLKVFNEFLTRKNIDAPIIKKVYDIVVESRDAEELIDLLMNM